MNRIKHITYLHNTLQYMHFLAYTEKINTINELISTWQKSQSLPFGFAKRN